ncbi:hypothetical protein, partial [Rugamonas violacea]|uniref:hypothetical protein n=1 Tax=Rugamonas sp. CCM 8940 TaxID=2765359 RepID=UPI001F408B66
PAKAGLRRLPSLRQISQLDGWPLTKAMACDTDGASALSRIAQHASQICHRRIVGFLAMGEL